MEAIGGGGGLNPDPLDIRTAWVYVQWLDGNLSGYTGRQVQRVVWALEDEKSYNSLSGEEKNLYNASSAGLAWGNDFHGVMVMNLDGPDFSPAQSQLIRTNSVIPVPGAVLLGLIGMATLRRMR